MTASTLPETLTRPIKQDRLAHAYLFYGQRCHNYPETVIHFFRRLVCEDSSSTPCEQCVPCKQIGALTYSDLVTINPPDSMDADTGNRGSGQIGVDRVREDVVATASLTSSEHSYKLFWLNNMAQFTSEASNALLKVLEEPPGQSIFVLTARSLGDCLPTIRSRCQWIRFEPDVHEQTSIEETCRAMWPDEEWAESSDDNNEYFATWKALLRGKRRSSDISWSRSSARGFLTYLLVLIHRKYRHNVPEDLTDALKPIQYNILPDILERFDELEQGGQPVFVVNSLLEKIHFPGARSECRHVI